VRTGLARFRQEESYKGETEERLKPLSFFFSMPFALLDSLLDHFLYCMQQGIAHRLFLAFILRHRHTTHILYVKIFLPLSAAVITNLFQLFSSTKCMVSSFRIKNLLGFLSYILIWFNCHNFGSPMHIIYTVGLGREWRVPNDIGRGCWVCLGLSPTKYPNPLGQKSIVTGAKRALRFRSLE